MSESEIEMIRGLLERKIELLEEILICAQTQAALSYLEHATEYQSLVETREKCIDNLKILDNTLQERLESMQKTGRNPLNEQVTTLKNKSDELLREILVLDQANISKFSKEMQDVKSKLAIVRQGRKGNEGYAAAGKIDQKGVFMDNHK